MAQKKIGIYGTLQSTANSKVEDLYLIVDGQSIIFSVKNIQTNEYIAFEYFVNHGDNQSWSQLVAYLQNNSKLMHAVYHQIHFVMNTPRVILSQQNTHVEALHFQHELNVVHGIKIEEEVYTNSIGFDKVIVFGVPDALSTLLTRSFPTGKWYHYAQFLIQQSVHDGVYISLFEFDYCLLIVKDGIVQLCNYANLESPDQNSYMVLNSCVQVGVDTNSTALFIQGYHTEAHSFVQKIAPYFESLQVSKGPTTGVGASLNASYPNHTYSTYFIF